MSDIDPFERDYVSAMAEPDEDWRKYKLPPTARSEGPVWIVEDKAPLDIGFCDGCGMETAIENLSPLGGNCFCGVCFAPVRNTRIADAARLAVPDIETVFRLYGHIQTHPLPNLRALLDVLTPPAPEWQAKDEDE